MLGLDIYLAALQDDPLNANLIYAAGLKANANRTQVPAKVNGNVPHANCPELPLKVNGNVLHANGGELHATCPELAEQDLKDTFGRFGRIEGIVMSAKASGKRSRRHALIKYQSSESAEAVLNSPVELWDRKSHTCPALTPPHLRSWVTTGTTPAAELPGDQDQDQEVASVMRKLDGRVRKLFRSLPEHALSIVLLPGVTGPHGNRAGLCFMEVKQATPPLPAPGTEPIT